MTPSQAAQKYSWVKYDETSKTIDLFCDHHMLSTLRTCEAKFQLDHILQVSPDYSRGEGRKPWFLDFGAMLHECLEAFYLNIKKSQENPDQVKLFSVSEFMNLGKELWLQYDMEYYKDKDDKYDEIGGLPGFLSLLVQYYAFYMDLRVRVVDTEISFGFNKEVPIGQFELFTPEYDLELVREVSIREIYKVNCYLTGRIDLLVDNGNKIAPVDHKHTHKFRGDEWKKFNPQDGITGYILAINSILKSSYPSFASQGRSCLSAWIYHISGCTPSKNRKTGIVGERFKTTPIDKTPEQLDEFKLRQLTTFKRIAALLFNNEVPQWSTHNCHNIFMRDCPHLPIHEAPSREWQQIIQNHYVIGKEWNPSRKPE